MDKKNTNITQTRNIEADKSTTFLVYKCCNMRDHKNIVFKDIMLIENHKERTSTSSSK